MKPGCATIKMLELTGRSIKYRSILRDMIVYRDIKVYCNNVTTFSHTVAFHVRDAFCSITQEPSNQSL